MRTACLPSHGPAPQTPFSFLAGTPQIQRVVTVMIRDHEVLFPKSKDAPLSPPAQSNDPKKPPVARSSVGWDATEDPAISRSDSFSNTVRAESLPPSSQLFLWSRSCHVRVALGGNLGSLGYAVDTQLKSVTAFKILSMLTSWRWGFMSCVPISQ